jgi:hypothetical protein
MLMFERLLKHIHDHSDVVFEPMIDYVERWKQENPIVEWARTNPTLAGSEWHER